MKLRLALFIAFTPILLMGAGGSVRQSSNLKSTLITSMTGTQTPGMGAVVFRDGRIEALAVAGVRRTDRVDRVRPEDSWIIGSTGKPQTVAMVARLVERGVLSWDAPLSAMLPVVDAPANSKPLLDAVEKQLGVVPNLFRLVSTSPAALEGYLSLNSALGRTLDAKTRERIALAIAQANGCDYCLSAHTYLGLNLAKIDDAEIALNRAGHSGDAKADAAVVFARKVLEARGHVNDADSLRMRGQPLRQLQRPSHRRSCRCCWLVFSFICDRKAITPRT